MKYLTLLLLLISTQLFAQFIVNGNAVDNGGECYTLTTNNGFEVGTIWNSKKVDLTESFKIDFKLNFGTKDANGADGIAFSLQQVSTSVGTAGGGIGYEGIQPSVTVEFDTWANVDRNDPSYDHMSLMKNGDLDHNSMNNLAGPVQIDPNNINVEDGEWKEFSIEWNADSNQLTVLSDCVKQLVYKDDIVTNIFGNDPMAFWGFTSATGGSSNIQQVCVTIQTLDQDEGTLGCADTVQLNGPSGAVAYLWSPNQNINDVTAEDPLVAPLDTTRYYLNYTDRCGSDWIDSVDVNVTNILPVTLPLDTIACAEAVLIFDVQNSPVATYEWSNGDNTPTTTITQSGVYDVVVTVGECSDSAEVEVDFKECKIWIPNIITLNNDGLNDKFEVVNLIEADQIDLIIYNRWGRKVYEKENYQNEWGGQRGGDGRLVSAGVYFYVINAKGADHEVYNGFITVVTE